METDIESSLRHPRLSVFANRGCLSFGKTTNLDPFDHGSLGDFMVTGVYNTCGLF
jgi:hypothetical protein